MIDARCSLVANLWVTPTQRRLPSPSQPPLNVLQQANEPKRRETFAKSAFLWGDGGRRNRPQRRVHRLRWPAMTNGSPPVRFGGVRFTGLRKGLEHARFRCPGAPRRRQTRRLNTEPQSWLHSGAGETLARKSPAGAGLSQRMRACPEGGKSTDTIPQAVAQRTRDSRRLVGRDSHRTRGLGGGSLPRSGLRRGCNHSAKVISKPPAASVGFALVRGLLLSAKHLFLAAKAHGCACASCLGRCCHEAADC
jgi:hypothetical protein